MHGGAFNLFYDNAHVFKPIIRFLLRKSDMIICLSPQWHDYYRNTFSIPHIVTVPNPVELNTAHERFSLSPTIHLLFLGKICDDKGIFSLIEYLKTNKYFLDNRLKLAIGGIGDDARLLSVISSLCVSNIEFHGWADESTKKQLLDECDIFILPSRYEGLPVSILEAMAYRKPIIATDVGGISSIVKPGYNGWLFDSNDIGQLDLILDEIFTNRLLLRTYGMNSYQEASKYSSEEVVHTLSGIYESLIVE